MSRYIEISAEWISPGGWSWKATLLPGPYGCVYGTFHRELGLVKGTMDAEIYKASIDAFVQAYKDTSAKSKILLPLRNRINDFFASEVSFYVVRVVRYYDLAPGALASGEPLHDRETFKPWGSNPGDSDVLKVDIRFGEISKEWNWSCVVDGKAYNGSVPCRHCLSGKETADSEAMRLILFGKLGPDLAMNDLPGFLYFEDKPVDVRVTRHYNVDLKGEVKP